MRKYWVRLHFRVLLTKLFGPTITDQEREQKAVMRTKRMKEVVEGKSMGLEELEKSTWAATMTTSNMSQRTTWKLCIPLQ